MLDIVLIRERPEAVKTALRNRNEDPTRIDAILALDVQRRDLLQEVEALRAERNRVSKQISRIKDKAEREPLIAAMRQVGERIGGLEAQLRQVVEQVGGAKIYLKREDLAHSGAHKINNTIGQILLAGQLGKTRIIAETGAGQHGVATATVCALKGMECIVYMGALDVERQAPNVKKMKMLGADPGLLIKIY